MKPRVTMADLARQAGVHTSTVSLALRNHPSIPMRTRQRIQALADRMNYRPDPALSSLMAFRRRPDGRPHVAPLAYLTHWNTVWGWKQARAHARFFAGASSKAQQLGYRLDHFWLGEPHLRVERMSEILAARGIHGLIVASHLPENDMPLALDWSRLSAVRIDYYPHEPALHTVTNDQRAIIQLTMQRVIEAGYRRIGFVIPHWWDSFSDRAWSAGFLAEQLRLDPKYRIPILFFSAPVTGREDRPETREYEVSSPAFQRWLRRYRPEVLISKEQFVKPALQAAGLQVPRDIAFAEIYLDPDGTVAGVRHNCDRVGELAVEILVGQLHQNMCGVPSFPTATLVEGTWFDGASLPRRAASRAVSAVAAADAGAAAGS